jgi:outer membrane protein assembly factor BamB
MSDSLTLRDRCAVGSDGRIYLYRETSGKPFELLCVDPAAGTVEIAGSPCDPGVLPLSIEAASTGAVYIGTGPTGILCRFSSTDGIVDLGTPVPGQTEVRCLIQSEGNLYGGTAPDGHLFALDLVTGEVADYGSFHPGDELRFVEVGLDGQIYCGLVSRESNLIRFSPQSHHRVELLPKVYAPPTPSARS